MEKGENAQTRINVGALVKKRLHLLKISIIPFLFMIIGSYLMMSTMNLVGSSESAMNKNTIGVVMIIIAIIWLIIVYSIDAKRTFKEWKIVKKQKHLLKKQKYKKQNKFVFLALAIFITIYVYFRGTEGYYNIFSVVKIAIYLAIIWSIWISAKNWIKQK